LSTASCTAKKLIKTIQGHEQMEITLLKEQSRHISGMEMPNQAFLL